LLLACEKDTSNPRVDEYIDSTYLEGPVVLGTYVYSFLAIAEDGNTGDKAIVVSVE